MIDKSTFTPPIYLINDKPLQSQFNNNYTRAEKVDIVMQLMNDYQSGILTAKTCKDIIDNKLYGSFTAKYILNDMQQKNIIKENPYTKDNRPLIPPRSIFDW